jgi:proline iminopeptidase
MGSHAGIAYVIDHQPQGVKSLILSSGHASSSLWASEQHRLIKYLSAEDQEAIRHAETTGQWEDPAYLRANDHYFEQFVISVDEHIPRSQWHLFRHSRHTCFIDAHEEYCQILTCWLQKND